MVLGRLSYCQMSTANCLEECHTPHSVQTHPLIAGRDRGRGGGEWEEGSGRKGVWDRLKAPPQLAGDFDAGDEFEAPQKRRIPENAMP